MIYFKMSKGKLAKFADMARYENVFQYPYSVVENVPFEMKGHWRDMYFHNDNPIVLELGCGKGEYTVELARLYPDVNFIGVDIKGARMWTGATQALNDGLKNVDYYLLHMIGGGGMEQFRKRYIDNGMIDFLVKEREAGRIRRLGWSFHGDIEVYDYALQMHDRGEVHWDFVQIQLNYVDWKHASGSNFKAEYLYDELAKRKIPAAIMEPLLDRKSVV